MNLQTIIAATKDLGIHPRLASAFQDFLGHLQATITTSQATVQTLRQQQGLADSFLRQRPQPPQSLPSLCPADSHASVLDLRTANSPAQYKQNQANYIHMARELSTSAADTVQSTHTTALGAREKLFASYDSLLTIAQEITTQNQLTLKDLHFLQTVVFPFSDIYASDHIQNTQDNEEEQP